MNNNNIESILQELYELDPSFKAHEAELRKIVQELILVRPDTKFDEQFAAELRHKLSVQANWQTKSKGGYKKLIFSLAGSLAVVALIILGGVYFSQNRTGQMPGIKSFLQTASSKPQINTLGNQAFGQLSYNPSATPSQASNQNNSTGQAGGFQSTITPNSTASQSPDGSVRSDALSAPVAGQPSTKAPSGSDGSAIVGILPRPIFNNKYVYKGGDFSVPSAQMAVFRRIKSSPSVSGLTGLLNQAVNGLMDFNTFNGLQLSSMSASESDSSGYTFNLQFDEGTVNIYKNLSVQPVMSQGSACSNGDCVGNVQPQTPNNTLSDQDLIRIANNFISQHKISLANYGSPEVLQQSFAAYPMPMIPVSNDQSQNSGNIVNPPYRYYSDNASVVYPLHINGQKVVDQNGEDVGITVAIDEINSQVVSLNGLQTENYDSSNYPVLTDKQQLIQMAENGGANGGFYGGSDGQEIDLDTPSLAYLQYTQYSADGTSQELLIPALLFPVTNTPSDTASVKNIVVPLVTGFLSQNSGGVAQPMKAKVSQ